MHSAAPRAASVAGGQGSQAEALALPSVETWELAGQALGCALPAGQKLPAGQGRQKGEAPVGVKAPAGHPWHAVAPAELKVPGLHSAQRPSVASSR